MAKQSGRSKVRPLESIEYSESWARQVLATGKANARRLLTDYKQMAVDKRLAEADRLTANQRARALARIL